MSGEGAPCAAELSLEQEVELPRKARTASWKWKPPTLSQAKPSSLVSHIWLMLLIKKTKNKPTKKSWMFRGNKDERFLKSVLKFKK